MVIMVVNIKQVVEDSKYFYKYSKNTYAYGGGGA